MKNKTIDYYNEHVQEFIQSTIDADMSSIYKDFLPLMPPGGSILDLGCGSGRDSLFFKNQGYEVVALDASRNMCKQAEMLIGHPVINMKMEEMDFENQFNGIWACASLLHVEKTKMPEVLQKLIRALLPGGIIYASWKYGFEEKIVDGRYFCNNTEITIMELVSKCSGIELIKCWNTYDVRQAENKQDWVNVLFRKQS